MTHISRKKQEHTQPFKMVAISTYLKNTIIFGAFPEGIYDMHDKGFNLSLNLSIPFLFIYQA